MPNVSLTTFVDFVCKSGRPKFTVVRQWKRRPDYSPATDFYKQLRDAIIDMHRMGKNPSVLDNVLAQLNDRKRIRNYPAMIESYKVWCGRRSMPWFDPTSSEWSYADLSVSVNPELGLELGGVPYLVKLYFKRDELARGRADVITHLMGVACGAMGPPGCAMSVLDVRRGKLFTSTGPATEMDALLQGEAAYWSTVWSQV